MVFKITGFRLQQIRNPSIFPAKFLAVFGYSFVERSNYSKTEA